jgi:hypothetical protein
VDLSRLLFLSLSVILAATTASATRGAIIPRQSPLIPDTKTNFLTLSSDNFFTLRIKANDVKIQFLSGMRSFLETYVSVMMTHCEIGLVYGNFEDVVPTPQIIPVSNDTWEDGLECWAGNYLGEGDNVVLQSTITAFARKGWAKPVIQPRFDPGTPGTWI